MKLTIVPPKDSYVAISGGVDSIAAAYFLRKYGIQKAYHFNHKMRPQNDMMEQKVRAFCEKHGIKLIVKWGSNLSTEAECRNARINTFFNTIGGTLITAHHLDDAAESYLLNGFRGHFEYLPIPIYSSFKTGQIIHPFLLQEKSKFQQIAKQHNLEEFVEEDETNEQIKGSRRNWIRNSIMPLLEQEQIGIKKIVKKRYMERVDK